MKQFLLVVCFVVSVCLWLGNVSQNDPAGTDPSPVSLDIKQPIQNYLTDDSRSTSRWFAMDVRNSLITKGFLNSGTVTSITTTTIPHFGGDFAANGKWYVVDTAKVLKTVDTTTGAFTTVGAITGLPAGINISGLAWDYSTSTMYMCGLTTGGIANLYTLNTTTAAQTLVGQITTGTVIDIACSNGGQLWGVKFSTTGNDSTIKINKATGAQTNAFDLGVNINFAHGMDFDPTNDSLYYWGYIGSGVNNLYRIDQTTGAATLITALTAGEYDAVGIAGSPSAPAGGSITMCRNGLNLSIPDNGGNANPLKDSITISGIPAGNEIKRITVVIDSVNHTWIGDLRFWLTKGTVTDTIISRIGLGTGGFPGAGNSCDNFRNTKLVDTAAALIQGLTDPTPGCGNNSVEANTRGYFKPKDPLSGFANNMTNPNGTYTLRICDNAAADVGTLKAWCLIVEYGLITSVPGNNNVVGDYYLAQNYPNPFNPVTTIQYGLAKSGLVSLKIYDITGREVANLVNGIEEAGNHVVNFNASHLSSGTYFYRIQTGDFVEVKRMVLLK